MEKAQVRYQKRSPEEWRELIEEQRLSGQSVREFIGSRGISKSSFWRWVKRLRDGADAEMGGTTRQPYGQGKAGSGFVELMVQKQLLAVKGSGDRVRNNEVRLLVGDGVCLELPQLPPPEYLALVARAYEAVRS